jgi:hypothetical protein
MLEVVVNKQGFECFLAHRSLYTNVSFQAVKLRTLLTCNPCLLQMVDVFMSSRPLPNMYG